MYRYPLEGLIKEYQLIRKKHGDKARSSEWMCNNGYDWLYGRIKTHSLSWHEFKKKAGFNDPFLRRQNTSKEGLMLEYKKIREEHCDLAKNSGWLCDNGYDSLYQQIAQKYDLSWRGFLKLYEGHFNISKEDLMI